MQGTFGHFRFSRSQIGYLISNQELTLRPPISESVLILKGLEGANLGLILTGLSLIVDLNGGRDSKFVDNAASIWPQFHSPSIDGMQGQLLIATNAMTQMHGSRGLRIEPLILVSVCRAPTGGFFSKKNKAPQKMSQVTFGAHPKSHITGRIFQSIYVVGWKTTVPVLTCLTGTPPSTWSKGWIANQLVSLLGYTHC